VRGTLYTSLLRIIFYLSDKLHVAVECDHSKFNVYINGRLHDIFSPAVDQFNPQQFSLTNSRTRPESSLSTALATWMKTPYSYAKNIDFLNVESK
jgi:hypothetical protein